MAQDSAQVSRRSSKMVAATMNFTDNDSLDAKALENERRRLQLVPPPQRVH